MTYLFFEYERLWQVLDSFRVVYCANHINVGQRIGLAWRDVCDFSVFLVWDPVTDNWSNSLFLRKLLFDSWCSISKSINHVSDHGFKSILGSVISNGKSVCYEVWRRLYSYFFYVCRWCNLESSTFEFGPLFLKQRSVLLWFADVFFPKWPVCFDISEDDRMASQTVDIHFWSQLWRLLFRFWKLSHDFFILFFEIKKNISAFIVFVLVSMILLHIWTWSFASRFFL